MPDAPRHGTVPPNSLWPLPFIAGLLPAIAAVAALWLSFSLELIPPCNPFLDGCVSISRAGRHDLPNHVFRALVLPAAALQGLTWLLCSTWLKGLGSGQRAMLVLLPWLGVVAGVFLVLYGTFLGTEGPAYRWLRRYGVIFYFGFTSGLHSRCFSSPSPGCGGTRASPRGWRAAIAHERRRSISMTSASTENAAPA